MRCRHCGEELGEGVLPARCPACGENLRKRPDGTAKKRAAARATAQAAQDSREDVEGLTGIGKGSRKGRLRNVLLALVGLVIVGGFCAGIYYGGSYLMKASLHVPDVMGWRVEKATEQLKKTGYKVGVEKQANASADPGTVVSQSPAAGESLPKDGTVWLVVAEECAMPEVVGLPQADAEAALAALGIRFETEQEASTEPTGTVIASTVPAGNPVGGGTLVKLTVAFAPLVPDVAGKTQLEAQNLIVQAGLGAVFVPVAAPGGTAVGTVVSSDPAPGTQVAPGDVVRVSVAAPRSTLSTTTAQQVLKIVYDNQSPSDESIGAALSPLLSPESPFASLGAHDLWWKLVKSGGKHANMPKEIQALPRQIVASDIEMADDGASATANLEVRWKWDALGEAYKGKVSKDEHEVRMTFDEQGRLLTFEDDMTDVPHYRVDAQSKPAGDAAQKEGQEAVKANP